MNSNMTARKAIRDILGKIADELDELVNLEYLDAVQRAILDDVLYKRVQLVGSLPQVIGNFNTASVLPLLSPPVVVSSTTSIALPADIDSLRQADFENLAEHSTHEYRHLPLSGTSGADILDNMKYSKASAVSKKKPLSKLNCAAIIFVPAKSSTHQDLTQAETSLFPALDHGTGLMLQEKSPELTRGSTHLHDDHLDNVAILGQVSLSTKSPNEVGLQGYVPPHLRPSKEAAIAVPTLSTKHVEPTDTPTQKRHKWYSNLPLKDGSVIGENATPLDVLNRGSRMMEKMGHVHGQGLGPSGGGNPHLVSSIMKTTTAGLGYSAELSSNTDSGGLDPNWPTSENTPEVTELPAWAGISYEQMLKLEDEQRPQRRAAHARSLAIDAANVASKQIEKKRRKGILVKLISEGAATPSSARSIVLHSKMGFPSHKIRQTKHYPSTIVQVVAVYNVPRKIAGENSLHVKVGDHLDLLVQRDKFTFAGNARSRKGGAVEIVYASFSEEQLVSISKMGAIVDEGKGSEAEWLLDLDHPSEIAESLPSMVVSTIYPPDVIAPEATGLGTVATADADPFDDDCTWEDWEDKVREMKKITKWGRD